LFYSGKPEKTIKAMKKSSALLILCVFIFFSSCTTVYITGRNFDDTNVPALTTGKTTETEVVQMFGEPFNRGLIDQYRVFIYSYEENEFPEHSGNEIYIDKRYKSLMIVFDENQVVKHFTYNVPVVPGVTDMLLISKERIKQQEEDAE
jgi:hypothetical protein